ncbi:protein POOR HOMOLOGOUS SYNAPSIS 1 [Prunus yedoensis var. nudiflora]|uniref:Protein POOR HOMOLOGOUS SYNAPSIS 1 n=1 Tax=Prunus yedoensis var. nudiflora TaxID=2094558 RepID=A0A314Y0A6_PRUYE|nr:protein POOR HOMOLOGOUS SYNAPSIS 1 [Prunus yedoensis var. nudiflora]
MAGTLSFLTRKRREHKTVKMALSDARERWEVHFSRFFGYPPISSTCPDLVPLPTRVRNRRPAGNWVSSSLPALLQLVHDHSISEVLLTVCFSGKVLEEHYVSKLQFVSPQVSCNPGFPARGTRAVFISYRDCVGEVQKFALRFLSADEAQRFMNSLKEIFNMGRDIEPLNTDLGSEISAQSEFMSSNIPLSRVSTDLNIMPPSQTCTTQISPSLNNEAKPYSHTQEVTNIHNFQRNFPAFPPGFTSLPSDCHPAVEQGEAKSTVSEAVNLNSQILPPSFTSWLSNSHPVVEQVAAQSTVSQEVVSQEVNLISQLARYGRDASFQDMLTKMERVIHEMGGDLTL